MHAYRLANPIYGGDSIGPFLTIMHSALFTVSLFFSYVYNFSIYNEQ